MHTAQTLLEYPTMYWLAILLVFLALVYWYGVSKYSLIANVALNGPKPLPYIGNLFDVYKYGGFHKMILEYFRRYGRVHKMYIGRDPAIVVNDPEMVKEILVKEFNKFPDRQAFIKPKPPIDSGLFLARGATWRRVRRTLTPTFTAGKLKQIVPIIETSTGTLLKRMETFSSMDESVDCNRMFSLFALDVIMKAAFGYETNVQTTPDEDFIARARSALNIPIWVRFFSMFPFSGYFGRYVSFPRGGDYFMQLAMTMVKVRQKEGAKGRRDLVQLMLEAHEQTVDGVAKLSDDELAAQSLAFLLAGYETTGSTLSSTAYQLATHPEFQDKLIEELDEARANRGDTPLYDLIHNIDYLDRVICEVLRLTGPVFLIFRECAEECDIKGVHFPKGVGVNIPAYVLHRDPEAWDHPETFDPDHFSPEAKEKRHPYSYMPFGMGPRQCIGMRFALTEIKIALVNILEKFKFERAPETKELEMEATLLLRAKGPIVVKMRKR